MSGNAREILNRMSSLVGITFEEEMDRLQLIEESTMVTVEDVEKAVRALRTVLLRRFVWGVESGVEPLGESRLGASDPHPPDRQR